MAISEIITKHPKVDLTPTTAEGLWHHSHEYNVLRYGLRESSSGARRTATTTKSEHVQWLEELLAQMPTSERRAIINLLQE